MSPCAADLSKVDGRGCKPLTPASPTPISCGTRTRDRLGANGLSSSCTEARLDRDSMNIRLHMRACKCRCLWKRLPERKPPRSDRALSLATAFIRGPPSSDPAAIVARWQPAVVAGHRDQAHPHLLPAGNQQSSRATAIKLTPERFFESSKQLIRHRSTVKGRPMIFSTGYGEPMREMRD